jgi:hypothetical protein
MTIQEKNSLIRLLGVLLFMLGIYLFVRDISLVGTCQSYFCYGWQNLAAPGSVIACMGGVLSVFVFQRKTTTLGWLLLGLGVLLVYLSGGMLLKPIAMLTFIASFTAMAYGHQLMKRRRMTVSMKH